MRFVHNGSGDGENWRAKAVAFGFSLLCGSCLCCAGAILLRLMGNSWLIYLELLIKNCLTVQN
jgi:hypothetical protein